MDTDTDTPTRWRRRKEARPQEILEAALMVFAEKGYASARMDDIAARALAVDTTSASRPLTSCWSRWTASSPTTA